MRSQLLLRYFEWKRARDEKFEKTWHLNGRLNPWRFALIRGVLVWALPIIVTMFLVTYLKGDIDTAFRMKVLLTLVPVVLLFGVAYGWFQWWAIDRSFKKMKRNAKINKKY